MGNSTSRVVGGCFVPSGNTKDGVNLEFLEPLDEGLGHSFCYIRPVADSPALTPSNSERYTLDSSTLDSETYSGSFRQDVVVEDSSGPQRPIKSLPETTFKAISGASVSANVSTIRTGSINVLITSEAQEPAASFESTASFAAIPLQPVPRGSGPLNGFMSGPLERGFMSGPLERGFMSGPIDKGMFMSGPLEGTDRSNFSAPLAYGRKTTNLGRLMRSVSRPVRSVLSRTFTKRLHGSGWMHRFLLHPMTKLVWHAKEEAKLRREGSRNFGEFGPWETEYSRIRNLQWAHGKAGEDRVHVVLSEEQGWLFVGIYDGFSGPDAPDFLMSNLYKAIDKELEGLLWDYDDEAGKSAPTYGHLGSNTMDSMHYEKGECVVSQLRDDDFEKQCGNLGSQCEGEILSVRSNEDESGGRPITALRLGGETLETGGIIVEKGGLNGIDHLHVANEISKDQGLFAGVENAETSVNIDAPESESFHVTAKKYRKSKRLYELLQMERVEDFDMKSSQVASASNENSWDLKPNSAEELYTRETLPTAGLVLCSRSIGEGSSVSMEEASSLRESEGVLEESSRNGSVASVSPSGQKHMMKRSLFTSKVRKMYRKQKSLRKKLFPWSYDWHRDKTHVNEGTLDPSVIRKCKSGPVDHDAVMKAMSRALEITEVAYMEMVGKALDKNPELALMGSCVLVMLMKDQDVYVMNLGDSRAILAQDRLNDRHSNPNLAKDDARHRNRSSELMVRVELDRISEESPIHNQKGQVRITNKNREISLCRLKKRALQLSTDHSTDIEEEVIRIKAEHADDAQAIMNGRVKGQLKVSRAFGAGFLKKADFNEALLEMFRIDYIGSSPYISCIPWVLHHRLCSIDRFLVLSSDGLYQYFSNEEVVSHVAWFMENVPEGDPAQYLIAELLFRAAKKNGMDFHDLLDIPQGDRRKYHDDVSVMVISLEGRIWRSSG